MPFNIRDKLLTWMFARLFASYDYPFVKSDELIGSMLPHERKSYMESARRVSSEQAFNQELQECVRHFYQELALKGGATVNVAMMRGALMFVKAFQSRMTYLGRMSEAPQSIEATDME